MHAELNTGNGIDFLAADIPNRMEYHPGTNYTMSLTGDNEGELMAYFTNLSAGGMVNQPLEIAPWGDSFGIFNNKYGLTWFVNINSKK